MYSLKICIVCPNIMYSFKNSYYTTEYSVSFQNLYCMSEYSIFPQKSTLYVRIQYIPSKIHTVCPNTLNSQNLHCTFEYIVFSKFTLCDRVQCIFHIYTTRLSVVHFHAKHYTTECNVFFMSA